MVGGRMFYKKYMKNFCFESGKKFMFSKIFGKKFLSSAVFLVFFINLFSGYGVFGKGLVNLVDYGNFERYGSLVESFRGNGIGKVVIIDDLHQNEEVQKNIVEILRSIKAKEKENFKKIFVEGLESGRLDLGILGVLPRGEREKYLDEFTRRKIFR